MSAVARSANALCQRIRSRLKAELQQEAWQGWSSAFRRLPLHPVLVASRESLVEL